MSSGSNLMYTNFIGEVKAEKDIPAPKVKEVEATLAIVTDSSVSFPKTYTFSHHIHVVENVKYVDEKEYEKTYKKLLRSGIKMIFSIHVDSVLSPSYQTACAAAEKVSKLQIKVFNSEAYSLGLGLLVQQAAEAIQSKKTAPQVELFLKENIQNQRHWLVLNSLEHLKGRKGLEFLGGGMAKAQADVLHFKPLISIKNGTKVIGAYVKFSEAVDHLIEEIDVEYKKRGNRLRRIAIEYKGLYYQALILLKLLKSRFKRSEVLIYEAGPFTSALYGSEILGVSII